MSLTPDPDPTAAGGANTDPDEGHQPAVNPPEQVDVRRWNDALFQWGRRNGPLVAGLGVATLALVLVGMRLAGARRRRSWDRAGTGLFQSGTGLLQPRTPKTYRVFATREGLVGGTTANGHVIAPRDHFVALPSGRALSPRNTGTYSVTVCADNGRCETAPVWDVGPWNTRDDYWNPSAIRQNWSSLPQGTPEAQAAYQNGYNGGKDQFGRTVTNPAGIDLADGTFWDGLGLTNNSWVNVTYLWT